MSCLICTITEILLRFALIKAPRAMISLDIPLSEQYCKNETDGKVFVSDVTLSCRRNQL